MGFSLSLSIDRCKDRDELPGFTKRFPILAAFTWPLSTSNSLQPVLRLPDLLESVTNLGNELLLRTCSECLTVVRADKGKKAEHLFPENLCHDVFRQPGVEPNDAERKLG